MEIEKATQLNLDTTVGLTITDIIDQIEINELYGKMKTLIEKNGEVNLIIQINDIKGIKNLKAIFTELRYKWFVLRHLRKYAIVTDKNWIENLNEIAGFLTPKIEIEEYGMDELQEAIDWINAPTHNEKNGMAIWSKENYLHLIVYDKLTLVDYKILNKTMHDYEKEVSLLIEFSDFEGLTLRAFLEDLKMGFSHYRKFKKIAIVLNKNLKTLVKLTDLMTPGITFKSFPYHELEAAIHWLNE